MNILICNVGSTSLKYQLFRMPEELVLASGGAERVGAGEGRFYAKTHENGALTGESAVFPTHREAIARMLRQLTDTVLPDLSALDCVGFKVVLAKGISGAKLSNNQHKVDQAWDWLRRIWIAWAVINGIGAFIAYVAPLFQGLATIQG